MAYTTAVCLVYKLAIPQLKYQLQQELIRESEFDEVISRIENSCCCSALSVCQSLISSLVLQIEQSNSCRTEEALRAVKNRGISNELQSVPAPSMVRRLAS